MAGIPTRFNPLLIGAGGVPRMGQHRRGCSRNVSIPLLSGRERSRSIKWHRRPQSTFQSPSYRGGSAPPAKLGEWREYRLGSIPFLSGRGGSLEWVSIVVAVAGMFQSPSYRGGSAPEALNGIGDRSQRFNPLLIGAGALP